jgi:hypothetical protein
MAVSVPVNLNKAWVEQWPDPRGRADLTQALMALSMDVWSARAWMSSIFAVGSTPAELLEVAEEWSSVGLPASAALMWAENGCCFPTEARDWHLRGFTAEQVEFITNVIAFNRRGQTFDNASAEAAAWRNSGLSPRLVLLGVANDEPLEVMLKKVAEGKMMVSVQGTMHLLAGLRGVDVQALQVDWPTLARARRAAMLAEGWR